MRRVKGDDGGCFASALASVRKWGGVLEHPEASAAWSTFGLIAPPKTGAWVAAGDWKGWTCCVEQGHYGHRARKATWLYASRVERLPSLNWGKSAARLYLGEPGIHSAAAGKARRRAQGYKPAQRIAGKELAATPLPFRDVLLSIARSARKP